VPKVTQGKAKASNGRLDGEWPPTADLSHIAEDLRPLAAPIADLQYDPDNANQHDEAGIEVIKASLREYGQQQVISVRRSTWTVIAGNGRLRAARELGWTHMAVSWNDLDDLGAVGYGLADNRSAELSKRDPATVARLQLLLEQGGREVVGWTPEEIIAIRVGAVPPDQFPEVDEEIQVEHVCPRCGYHFSGGQVVEVGMEDATDGGEEEAA
jgi:hypothetical protein